MEQGEKGSAVRVGMQRGVFGGGVAFLVSQLGPVAGIVCIQSREKAVESSLVSGEATSYAEDAGGQNHEVARHLGPMFPDSIRGDLRLRLR